MIFRRLVHIVTAGLLLAIPSAVYADVVISSAQTQNMSCSGGVCSPTATNAVLNAGDLETLLASGNVEVTTTASGVQAGNIDLTASLTWSAASTLVLDAYQSISVQKPVAVPGSGGLTVTTNDGGSNGTFSFGSKGHVTFQNLSSPLIINGMAYTLVDSLPALAAAVKANSSGAYALADDYDASKDGAYKNPPIASLSGVIEGLGNTISHVSMKIRTHYIVASLVEEVEQTGEISDLRLTDIRYRAIGKYASSSGLVGSNYGYLFGDAVSGTIEATGSREGGAGGLVQFNLLGGIVVACSADVSISTSSGGDSAGLANWNSGTITLSHASGTGSAAGFVGANEGAISESFATGSATWGGFVEINEGDGIDAGTIENSYSTGPVTAEGGGGGFVQSEVTTGSISDSYSAGAVPTQNGGFGCTGSAVVVSDDYWDITTSGTAYGWCNNLNIDGTTGLTTQQLRKKLPRGFDRKIWAEDPKINNGFPYLIANPPPE